MSPQIALAVFGCLVLGALVIDSRRKPDGSTALWVPLAWLVILASRPVVQWFDPSSMALGVNVEEGSPIDRTVLTALMAIAVLILLKRRLRWTEWLRANPWIFLFILYFGLSVLWSDFASLAFKRWLRAIGSVLMVLIVLSEEDPIAAVGTLVRRCAYILIPCSVLLIKYYRDIAVGYNEWTGEEYLVGATTDKNALGRLCLVSGLFSLWELAKRTQGTARRYGLDRLLSVTILVLTLWLLVISKSATSLGSFLIGACILIGLRLPLFRRHARYLGTCVTLTAVLLGLLLALSPGLVELAVTSLGRNMTLTDRTYIWTDLLDMGTNPLVGVGYDSFWLGERLERFVRAHQVNEAHNGYLEVYLELGMIGVVLLAGMLLSMFFKAKKSLGLLFDHGRLRLVVLFVFLLYNLTESGYKPTTLMFFVLLLVGIDRPASVQPQRAMAGVVRGYGRHGRVASASATSPMNGRRAPVRPPLRWQHERQTP